MDFAPLLLLVLLGREVAALKLLRISVPPYTLRGKSALLECRYDLEADKLYTVSWYKDHEEFYRYVPRGEPTKHSYRVEGVKVDHRGSDDRQVRLQDVGLRTSGLYKCEVSAEAPNFNSVHAERSMVVVVLPQEGPTITGEEKVYATGDVLALNCSSDRSFPVARLEWFVNGDQVKPDSETVFEMHGLYSVTSSLRLQLEPDHIAGDKINMRGNGGVPTQFRRAPRRDAEHGSLRDGPGERRRTFRLPDRRKRDISATPVARLGELRKKEDEGCFRDIETERRTAGPPDRRAFPRPRRSERRSNEPTDSARSDRAIHLDLVDLPRPLRPTALSDGCDAPPSKRAALARSRGSSSLAGRARRGSIGIILARFEGSVSRLASPPPPPSHPRTDHDGKI